jgi:hypothetical protein
MNSTSFQSTYSLSITVQILILLHSFYPSSPSHSIFANYHKRSLIDCLALCLDKTFYWLVDFLQKIFFRNVPMSSKWPLFNCLASSSSKYPLLNAVIARSLGLIQCRSGAMFLFSRCMKVQQSCDERGGGGSRSAMFCESISLERQMSAAHGSAVRTRSAAKSPSFPITTYLPQ